MTKDDGGAPGTQNKLSMFCPFMMCGKKIAAVIIFGRIKTLPKDKMIGSRKQTLIGWEIPIFVRGWLELYPHTIHQYLHNLMPLSVRGEFNCNTKVTILFGGLRVNGQNSFRLESLDDPREIIPTGMSRGV